MNLEDFVPSRPDFLGHRTTYIAECLDASWKETEGAESGRRIPAAYCDANLVGSSSSPCGTFHQPVIDLDFPAHLEPSATEGHFHLYLNKDVEWEPFLKVLEAMKDAGLVEEGFYEMTKRRGQAFVRRPGVHKKPEERGIPYMWDDDGRGEEDEPWTLL